MSEGARLEVRKVMDLAARLRATVSDFAAREEHILRAAATERQNARSKCQQGAQQASDAAAGRVSRFIAACEASAQKYTDTHSARRSRILRFQAASLRSLPRRAVNAKESWMGELQMERFQAERKRDAGMQAAEQRFRESSTELARMRASLGALRSRARTFFAGYLSLGLKLKRITETGAPAGAEDVEGSFKQFQEHLAIAAERLRVFRAFLLPRVFSYLPVYVLALLLVAGCAVGAWSGAVPHYIEWGVGAGFSLAVLFSIHHLGFRQSKGAAMGALRALSEVTDMHASCRAALADKRDGDFAALRAQCDETLARIEARWKGADSIEADFDGRARSRLEARVPRVLSRNDAQLQRRLRIVQSECETGSKASTLEAAEIKARLEAERNLRLTSVERQAASSMETLVAEWIRETSPVVEEISTLQNLAISLSEPFTPRFVDEWKPPARFAGAARFGSLVLDLDSLPAKPRDLRLQIAVANPVSLPMCLVFPEAGSMLFETREPCGGAVMATMNNIVLRLFTASPPGKVSFTIIDPIALGRNFSGLMHLSDYEDSLINRKIWTQKDQIDERLGELSEHIEKVIQMYLRDEYATIAEYNEQAGSVSEKYHFLVIADFPAGFSEIASKRLRSIALSGPRCGIFTLAHWDQRQQLPDEFGADELRSASVCIHWENGVSVARGQQSGTLILDEPPVTEVSLALVHKIGQSSIDSNRVQVPFSMVAPAPDEIWKGETSAELRVAIGRTGATKLQILAIGKGTRQHALFAGKTGSGKSTLFHVIITNLALTYSPDQVEFYLIDFKKGVEFKCYAARRLPHARVVAIESDREFGLSVLQRVDEELRRRGDMFRALGAQDIAGYKRAGGKEAVPRCLLIIDEFQEFFVEDDQIAQTASLLFDRIVRQGRAFGIHVLLGSQTLGGAYSLARATLGQMVIRVALQCNEADAYLIMDDSNPAPRLLSRPGEGIYNDAAGAVEGNSPFQVVWLPDEERDRCLEKIREVAGAFAYRSPIVFEGNAPADLQENTLLNAVLSTAPLTFPRNPKAWLGAANSIKGPTEAEFRSQSGGNLLIVGQREETALNLLGVCLLALAAQYPAGSAAFYFLTSASPGSHDAEFINQFTSVFPRGVVLVRPPDASALIEKLTERLKRSMAGEETLPADEPAYIFVHGIQKFRKLRFEESFDFSGDSAADTGRQFNDIIIEGSAHGIHVLGTVDTYASVNRVMSRKALGEFGMRVVFQMSANDSASLIESPLANNLGLHRAIFYSENEGVTETFRPYAAMTREWLAFARSQRPKQEAIRA